MINFADLGNPDDPDFGNGAFFCAEGIVAKNDDPENRCRVQCRIPIIDEDEIHEVWARRFQLFVGAPGYGDYFVPELGVAVMLIGRFGDTNNLFYAPLFNEQNVAPPDFTDASIFGFRTQGDFKLITELDLQIRAGRISLESDGQINIIAPGGLFINGRKI